MVSIEVRAEPVARFPDARPQAASPPHALESPAATPETPLPPSLPVVPPRAPMKSGAEELADRGRRLEEAQRYTEAITAYSESIKLDPSRGETLLALAKLRMRLGESNEAELLLSSAARYASFAAEALTLRAHLRQVQGRPQEAAKDLENAARLSPDDVARTQELSAMYAARGAWPPALSLWRRAAAVSREADTDRQTKLQVRALTLLSAELDPVMAGRGPGYSWVRRAMAKIATR
jgi:tetratricopeptide (TPR) repeat protein